MGIHNLTALLKKYSPSSIETTSSGSAYCATQLNGTAAAVDGNTTTVGAVKLAGGSANCGPGGDAEVMANAVTKTGSSIMTEETKSGTSSGSAQTLIGVTTAVS